MKFLHAGLLLTITFLNISFVSAQTRLYVQKNDGQFIEKITFEESGLVDSLRVNFYCSYINLFRKQVCVTEKEYDYLNNSLAFKNKIDNSPVQNISNNETQIPSIQKTNPAVVAENIQPQVVYQIIEKAVPGPQGPAGQDGKDGVVNTIASFFPNTAVGGQYNSYGGNSTNPTGSGNLSSLTVSGDSSFSGKVTGAGLSACNTVTDKLVYNATTGKFECSVDQSG